MCYRLGTLANDVLAKNVQNTTQFQAEAALVKAYASDTAVEAAKLAMDVHASYGLTKDYPVEKIYRDAIIAPQIEGVSDMQRRIFANSVLG
jgi:alkylation response protein AidB-like acyl-CoA dehydrogenase